MFCSPPSPKTKNVPVCHMGKNPGVKVGERVWWRVEFHNWVVMFSKKAAFGGVDGGSRKRQRADAGVCE